MSGCCPPATPFDRLCDWVRYYERSILLGRAAGAGAKRRSGHANGPRRTARLDHLAQNQTLRARRRRPGSPTSVPVTLAVTSSTLNSATLNLSWLKSNAPHSSASSIRSVTNPSKPPPSSARCAAIPTSRPSIGCTSCFSTRTPTCTASSSTLASMPRAWRPISIAALDRLPRGATVHQRLLAAHRRPRSSRPGSIGTLLFGEYQVRTGHLVVAFLKTRFPEKRVPRPVSREFAKIKLEQLTDDFAQDRRRLARGRPCAPATASGLSAGAAPGETSGAIAPAEMGKQEALKRFTTDLTEKARKGEIDPIVGPRRGNPPVRGHSHAPPPEQPHPHRRSGRRQDRRRRRLRPAHCGRRRAAARSRMSPSARSTSACSRPAPA